MFAEEAGLPEIYIRLPDFTEPWHETVGQLLAASGGNLITTQRLMRHASPVVTARYAHLVNDEERKIMAGLLSDMDWTSGGGGS